MFKSGDEVVCINDSEPPQGEDPNKVVKGQTYTVTGMRIGMRPIGQIGPMIVARPELYVFLAEVPSPKGIGHFAFRFRKVEKKGRTTDISVFKEIADGTRVVPLEPAKKKEKV